MTTTVNRPLDAHDPAALNLIAGAINSIQWTPLRARYAMAAAVLDAQAQHEAPVVAP